jgi:sugar lactone lactonase YvrE
MMRSRCTRVVVFSLLLSTSFSTSAWSADEEAFAPDATFTTVATTPLGIEGLTGDDQGNLYVGARIGVAGQACPVYRIAIDSPALVVVGLVPPVSETALCSPLGVAFDASGKLFAADSGNIYSFVPSAEAPPVADLFATGLPGANGIAFDRLGNLFVSDGGTTQGRVWKVTPDAVVSEAFRVQPMSSDVNLVDGVGGVGRDVRGLPGGTVTITPTSRAAANMLASQAIVANGLAFDRFGNLLIADTARGAIWRARFDREGNLRSRTGCDTTFAPNTLCLDSVFVAHPILEGADGIALDALGNVYVSANERNVVAVVSVLGRVFELFRNEPDPVTRLRNNGPLEFPTSPFVSGRRVCTTSSDGGRRDNAPATAGEVGGPGQDRGKISCTQATLRFPGLSLPVR